MLGCGRKFASDRIEGVTWIDWVIAAFVLFAALQGLRRGLGAALIGVVAVIAAYLAASVWYDPLAEGVRRYLPLSPSWAATAAFLIVFLVVVEVIGLFVTLRARTANVPTSSRVLGLIVGAVRGMTLAAALLIVLLASPLSDPVQRDVDRSVIAPYAVNASRSSLRALAGLLPPALRPFGTGATRF